MKTKLSIGLGLALVPFFLAACAGGKPAATKSSGGGETAKASTFPKELDGTWKQQAIECENGKFGPAMKHAQSMKGTDTLMKIEGGSVVVHTRYWKSGASKKGKACHWSTQQHWTPTEDGKGFAIFTDSTERKSGPASC